MAAIFFAYVCLLSLFTSLFITIHKTDKTDREIRFSIFMLFGFFATYYWLPEDGTIKTLEEWAVGLENEDFQNGLRAKVFRKCWEACAWVLSGEWWVFGRRSLVESGGEGERDSDGEVRDESTAVSGALEGMRVESGLVGIINGDITRS
jgi:hypothetical protein